MNNAQRAFNTLYVKYFTMGSEDEKEGLTIGSCMFYRDKDGKEHVAIGPADFPSCFYKYKEITKEEYEALEKRFEEEDGDLGWGARGLLNDKGRERRDKRHAKRLKLQEEEARQIDLDKLKSKMARLIKEVKVGLIETKEELKQALELYDLKSDYAYEEALKEFQSLGYFKEEETSDA